MIQYMAHIMNTTYRHTKQVTRMMARCTQGVPKVYPRCTQALGRLMSMLRVSLEAAWSMLRVCLQYAYSMPRVCLAYAYTHLIRKPYAISVRARRTGSLLLTDQESAPYGLHFLRYVRTKSPLPTDYTSSAMPLSCFC